MAFGRMLTVNSGIRQLTLCGNMVGAGGARSIGLALPSNISLRILNLRCCGLGAEGARYIAQGLSKERAALTELHVGLNQVGDEGAAEFAEMIRINRSILEFYAEANGIKSRGGGLLAEALRDNDCLLKLWLLKNDLGADAVGKFALAVTHNKVLRCLGLTSFDALPPSVRQDHGWDNLAVQTLEARSHGCRAAFAHMLQAECIHEIAFPWNRVSESRSRGRGRQVWEENDVPQSVCSASERPRRPKHPPDPPSLVLDVFLIRM
ncbi:unnamed protein product [Prorocentrum cordatum]|uniref:Distal membrane arm assembly complex 2-like protein n=1 Tax=Prorocentrum cordatum TaxID=2364126 RepID=A0ABN9SKN6_9DINO|nr:unnamed protein product [Polarella glacialis]